MFPLTILLIQNLIFTVIKGYLGYKTIVCNEVALGVQLIIFLLEEKIMLRFGVFVKLTNFKIYDVIIGIAI